MKKFIPKVTDRMRLSVFRSNHFMYAQIIDDQKRMTLVSAHDMKDAEKNKVKRAATVGEAVAKKAAEKGIKKVWFDRGTYKYHGRVKALAEGARKGGLEF
jgi:large subunit ribosomal protein L18